MTRKARTAQLRDDLLAEAVSGARDEVARTDSKAATLLTLTTGALAGLVTFAHASIPSAAAIALWAAAALTAAALVTLLAVIRPRLHGASRGSILPSHRKLLECAAADLHAQRDTELRMFSALAVAKYRRIRLAVDLLLAATAALTAAVLIIVTH